jgi:hypothetical protein
MEGEHMTSSIERRRALQKGERPGFRSFTVGVSKEDLRVLAKHGYKGVLSTDHDQQAHALSLFITNMLAARRSAMMAASRRATPFQ